MIENRTAFLYNVTRTLPLAPAAGICLVHSIFFASSARARLARVVTCPLTEEGSVLALGSGAPALDGSKQAPEDGQEGEEEEDEGAPVDESVGVAGSLVLEDCEESQGDDGTRCNVTLTVEGVTCAGTLEEEQTQEDEDVADDSGLGAVGVLAKGGESSNNGQDDGETVPEGEGQMDHKGVKEVLALVAGLEGVEDGADGTGNHQHDQEGEDGPDPVRLGVVGAHGAQGGIDGVEQGEDGESPANTLDDGLVAGGVELVDDETEQKEVDQTPDAE